MSVGHETNKFKLFNDPIYGFIAIPTERIFDLIEHPYFQRLRRIGQLGLSYLVYPGAYHTRFHHALGAMHLMQRAVAVLQSKGHAITPSEAESVQIAILLHDIGHGPFSHALEHTLVNGVSHEALSTLLMERLNQEMDGALTEALEIFHNQHPKRFLHQLISSQLDMDRMDYLRRDAFYTGVVEGAINSERLLHMLNVADGELVLDSKGISSIEKFLISRSLMYWQVYMHKAVLSAEYMLVQLLRRAHELVQQGETLFAGAELQLFLEKRPTMQDFQQDPTILAAFTRLDDADILGAMKQWTQHADPVLRELADRLLNRRLFRIKFLPEALTNFQRAELEAKVHETWGFPLADCRHFVLEGMASNATYKSDKQEIRILKKSGKVIPLSEASEILPLSVYSHTITRPFVCWPKGIEWID
ncbi:MAG TPA: phosphohydrolase [Cryomorphaceae bacterium]|nr:phosphohydrolase [Cryomorphaceae bacterium]HBJ71371.1 phosphohydrolase [Cryomorphaceae bacterium]